MKNINDQSTFIERHGFVERAVEGINKVVSLWNMYIDDHSHFNTRRRKRPPWMYTQSPLTVQLRRVEQVRHCQLCCLTIAEQAYV